MTTRTLCDCRRPKCGAEVLGPNAGKEPVLVRTASGIRFQITCLGDPDGKPVDLRPLCMHVMVAEGELVQENGKNGNGEESTHG